MIWQAIATAPKDGSKILTFQKKYGPIVTRWLFDSAGTPCWWATGGGYAVQPTHWMPLPEPPQELSTEVS